jgi:putative transcriptional regulator
MDLTNQFLIAMPAMADPNFAQTVTYIYAHDPAGAIGLIINRPVDIRFSDLLDHLSITAAHPQASDTPVVQGGPVELERGFVLHQPAGNWAATVTINDNLSISISQDILQAIADGKGPEKALVALGYAGWGPGQLEAEVLDNAWLSCPPDAGIVFDVPYEKRWARAAESIGVDLARLSSEAGHA